MREERYQSPCALSSILTECKDEKQGDEHLEGKLKLEIHPHVQPRILLKCRVSLPLLKSLKKDLTSLQRRGIITPIETSTEWISCLVLVRKLTGKLRISMDPKPLKTSP